MMSDIRFKDFEDVLAAAGSLADAAEAHGSLCGALCSMSPYKMQDWVNEILPDGTALSDESAAMLERVFTATATSFGEQGMEFEPLLPDDEQPLNGRANALALWCTGFLYGLVDTDAVCLRPFDFADEYVFGSELTTEGTATPTSGFIKAPAGSDAMAFAWAQCLSKDPGRLTWGETGPRLVKEVVRKFALHAFLQDYRTFAPVAHFEWEQILAPGWTAGFPALTCAIHLWNEKWRRGGQDKDAHYPSDCLYEQLKAMYLGSPGDQGGSVV